MREDVVMPQMGESVAEGTVTVWLKEIGDFVERDEPLFVCDGLSGRTPKREVCLPTDRRGLANSLTSPPVSDDPLYP